QAWDALRVAGSSDGYEISNVWVSDVRDDAFENDTPSNGSIRDSLFDGVFSGISLGHPNMSDASHKVLELDGVLMRMESYLFKGDMTHQSPFKMEGKSPQLSISNSVFAIDDVDHVGDSRLQTAWDKTIHSSNNVFLNLSDKPLPGDYPMPPSGWTVLQGEEARDYWETARADWIASRGEEDPRDAGPAPEPVEQPEEQGTDQPKDSGGSKDGSKDGSGARPLKGTKGDDDLAGGAGGEVLRGRKGSDELHGRGGDDAIYGGAGGDVLQGGAGEDALHGRKGSDALQGGAGEDVLTGGAGRDAFIFGTAPDGSNVDTITDFKPGTDKIVLDTSVFTSLRGSGDTLAAASFETGSSAEAGNDHIIYKWKTGELFYDADGSGRGAQVQFAQLDTRLDLGADDFLLM
ncbi:M10 family metallopeptidase C-terminal domain-containing protein, partial [Cribrihabitans neustonicus]|uniref:M10 family metallopeptidase C-terminal domain-containing protein n=1 Tax=Cribrihabitans neustonicus TaxID=1429085 RepID=UPI003B58BAA7